MPDEKFRRRGMPVEVDTTEPAEFQIKGFQLSDDFLSKVIRDFKTIPFRRNDPSYGVARVRSVDGFDFLYVVGLQDGQLTVTIGDLWATEKSPLIEQVLKKADLLAIIRGASGL